MKFTDLLLVGVCGCTNVPSNTGTLTKTHTVETSLYYPNLLSNSTWNSHISSYNHISYYIWSDSLFLLSKPCLLKKTGKSTVYIYIYTNIKNIKIQHLVLPSISLHISTCCRWDKCPHFCETALARSSWPPWPRPMRHRVLWVAHPSGYSWDRSWSHRAWRVTWARRGVARLGGFLRWKMLVLLGKD